MANYFFFNPGMTNIETVVFGPDEKAVQIVANAPKTWVITNDVSNDGIADIILEFFKRYPWATIFSHQVYTEKEFFDIWGDDGEE